MISMSFPITPLNELRPSGEASASSWLWDGYLAPGNTTLLTSQCRTGKSTLITELVRCMERGEPFLGRKLAAGTALIVSEEPRERWIDRVRCMPVGGHTRIMIRPFALRRPTFDEWNALIDEVCRMRLDGQLDLLIIDSLARFLPGAWESNVAILVDGLARLHRLTADGTSILLLHRLMEEEPAVLHLHHRRRDPVTLRRSARGSGALLDFVDIAVELCRYGRSRTDWCRRQIVSLSRHPRTPDRRVYEWNAATGRFTDLGHPSTIQFERKWRHVLGILKLRQSAATHRELLMDWPVHQEKPAASVLYECLNRAVAEKRLRREGRGTSNDPWRYRLGNDDDEHYDRSR